MSESNGKLNEDEVYVMNVWAVPVEHGPLYLDKAPKKDPNQKAKRKAKVLEELGCFTVTKK